jgi:outer membrane protein OmpA-like peptidoglycan-associated protein
VDPAPAPQPAPQVITFPPLPAVGLGDGPIDLGASASSGLPVSFDSGTPTICSVSATGVVTVLATGTCVIVAHQPGNGTWLPAADSTESFGVTLPPLPAPTTVPVTTSAGKTTQSTVGGIPADATLTIVGPTTLPGVSSIHIVGTTVVVTAKKTFSGIVDVPVLVTADGRTVETTVPVTVRPLAPTQIEVTPESASHSRIAWTASPSATGYVVRVDGRVVCRTTATSCDVPALLTPNDHVVITSNGHANTVSDEAPGAYAPGKPVLLAVVHFTSDSSVLAVTAKTILGATETKIVTGGFTRAILTCHTDNAGSLVYNMALSAARCAAVAAFVKRELGIAHVTYRQAAFAFLRPVAPNTTFLGMAKNRRVEVYVK